MKRKKQKPRKKHYQILDDLDNRLEKLEKLSKDKIPSEKNYEEFLKIVSNYAKGVDKESITRYNMENHKGYSVAAVRMIHDDESELGINIFRYARNNNLEKNVESIFDEVARDEEVNVGNKEDLLSYMYYMMGKTQIERLEEDRLNRK